MTANRSVAVFDLGGVLIDWDPRYLYRKLFDGDDRAMEHFLATVCTQSWNEQQDAGRPFADAIASLKLVHPGKAELIDAWIERQSEMFSGRSRAPLTFWRSCVRARFLCTRSRTGPRRLFPRPSRDSNF